VQKPPPKKGLARIIRALGFSLDGLRSCYRLEAAFRQEVIIFFLLLPLLFFLPISLEFKLIVLVVNTLVLVVEVLNSSIEAIVDKASPEFHHLAKHAKDMASGAVFLALVLAGITWGMALYRAFF
jgi:diacylglycerol kinase (ATP)